MPTQTLVLNQSYAPIKIVSWQRAVTLLFQDKAEVIEEYEDHIRSTFLKIKMPAVVRLVNAFRRRKKPVKFSRVSVYARDKYRCQYCKKTITLSSGTYDHVKPRAQGGKTIWSNIVTSCADCNGRKGNRTPEEAGMKLSRKPVRPSHIPATTIPIDKESAPSTWRNWVW